VLNERQLDPVTDKDPERRNEAVFSRAEVETVISERHHARLPGAGCEGRGP
jgi:hypothetical protein